MSSCSCSSASSASTFMNGKRRKVAVSVTLEMETVKSIEQDTSALPKAIAIVGSTGTGKTQLAVDLAKRLDGEVISCDSVQMYKGLDIASAKVTEEEMQGIPHHLVNVLDPDETTWTVRDFRDHALKQVQEIRSRGKLPILAGGNMYYLSSILWPALLDDASKVIATDDVEENASELVPEGMTPHEYLSTVDPGNAEVTHPNDTRKILKSIRIFKTTGKKYSDWKKEQQTCQVHQSLRLHCPMIWLRCDSSVHEQRIRNRVDHMMDQGLLSEARDFVQRTNFRERAAAGDPVLKTGIFQAMGFKEFVPYFEAESDPTLSKGTHVKKLSECIEDLVISHRRYAKKQKRWIEKRTLLRPMPVYSIDTTDIGGDAGMWENSVVKSAEEIAGFFLRAKSLREDPPGWKRLNRDEATSFQVFYCKLCDVKAFGEHEWRAHTKTKRHKMKFGQNEAFKRNKVSTRRQPEDVFGFRALIKEEMKEENGSETEAKNEIKESRLS